MRIFPVLALVALTGCMSPVTDPAIIQAAGPQPTQARAEGVARDAVAVLNLRDPESAQIRNVTVGPVVTRPGIGTGWLVSFHLNGKNAYGAYVGFQKYNVILRADGYFKVAKADAWNP